MNEAIKIIVGILVLIIGFPIGNYLAYKTREELRAGQPWFKLIIILALIGGVVGLIINNDAVLFGFFFIVAVTSRSLGK